MGFLENLYFDIGKKIKNWAIWMAIIEAIGSVITGIVLLFDDLWWVGLLCILLGPIVAWVNTWILYGFGELIDKACDIAENTNISALPIRAEIARRNKEAEEKAKQRFEAYKKAKKEEKRQLAEDRDKSQTKILTFKEKLQFALKYQYDDGMIGYLKSMNDPKIDEILQEQTDKVRGLVQELLESLEKE